MLKIGALVDNMPTLWWKQQIEKKLSWEFILAKVAHCFYTISSFLRAAEWSSITGGSNTREKRDFLGLYMNNYYAKGL